MTKQYNILFLTRYFASPWNEIRISLNRLTDSTTKNQSMHSGTETERFEQKKEALFQCGYIENLNI